MKDDAECIHRVMRPGDWERATKGAKRDSDE